MSDNSQFQLRSELALGANNLGSPVAAPPPVTTSTNSDTTTVENTSNNNGAEVTTPSNNEAPMPTDTKDQLTTTDKEKSKYWDYYQISSLAINWGLVVLLVALSISAFRMSAKGMKVA